MTKWWPEHLEGMIFRKEKRGSSFRVCQVWGFCRVVLMSPALGRPWWRSGQAVFYDLCWSQQGRAHGDP